MYCCKEFERHVPNSICFNVVEKRWYAFTRGDQFPDDKPLTECPFCGAKL